MSGFSPLCPSSYFFETGSPTVSEVTYPARQGDNDLSTLPISSFPGLGFRPSNYCCQLGQQACYRVIFPSLWAYIELNSWVQNSISYLVWKNEVLFLLLKKCTCFFKEWILAMCFSVRKSKVQHVDNICPLIISAQHFLLMQFVSNSLFKATPLFEGSGEIRFLNSTCCVPGLMKATCHPGKCRAICSVFFLSKDNTCSQRSPPGVVPSRTRAPVVQCWTVLNHHDPRWFPSNRTLCSVGLPVLPGDILLLNIAWATYI